MDAKQNSTAHDVRFDRTDLPYRHIPELRDILVQSDFSNPSLDACPIAENVRKELLESKSFEDRKAIVAKHVYLVAALWTESFSRNQSRKYIEYEIIGLKTEGHPKAVLFLSCDNYQLMALAVIGMQEFDDFKTIRRKLKNFDDAYEIGGTFGCFLWRNTKWENTPVRLYSPEGDLFFSGIYRYSTAFNGNIKRELFSDEGVNMDDKDLSDLVLEHFPQHWKILG